MLDILHVGLLAEGLDIFLNIMKNTNIVDCSLCQHFQLHVTHDFFFCRNTRGWGSNISLCVFSSTYMSGLPVKMIFLIVQLFMMKQLYFQQSLGLVPWTVSNNGLIAVHGLCYAILQAITLASVIPTCWMKTPYVRRNKTLRDNTWPFVKEKSLYGIA